MLMRHSVSPGRAKHSHAGVGILGDDPGSAAPAWSTARLGQVGCALQRAQLPSRQGCLLTWTKQAQLQLTSQLCR